MLGLLFYILLEASMLVTNIHTFWPLFVIVLSNVLYNITSKAIPDNTSPWAVLVVTYLVSSFLSLIAYFIFEIENNFIDSVKNMNWTGFALGISMVGLEIGYIFIYRNGWKLSIASLLANILLAIILILIGIFIYHEHIDTKQFIGISLCIIGCLFLISNK